MQNFTCPECGKRMILDFATGKVLCRSCGYVRPDEISQLDAKRQEIASRQPRQDVRLTYKGEVTPRAYAAFRTGHDLLQRGDRQGAHKAFLRACDYQPDFTDAHLWAAKTTDEPAVQREHLEHVLAREPSHDEAVRMLMVLDRRLTPQQAELLRAEQQPQEQVADQAQAQARPLLCPICGGHLTLDERFARVECAFCGHVAAYDAQRRKDGGLLSIALLQRKAQPQRWRVGSRLVTCQQCGAEHTLPATKLSARCRFCSSANVLLSDVLRSFVQPDVIVPFRNTPEAIRAVIEQALRRPAQRLANLFNTNRIAHAALEGVYIPFWLFDAIVDVRQTRSFGVSSQTMTWQDIVSNVAIPAVQSPPARLLLQLAPFPMQGAVDYAPKWLAEYPAELYTVELDRASLEARSVITEQMRRKYPYEQADDSDDGNGRDRRERIYTLTQVANMIFSLALMPIWIATLIEVDGDVRLALVNDQTGEVVFGETHRQPRR
ncbi:MAG: TFIIB-type zinc ribbon-containing protein [Anaerolineae bacterium]|nr:TFIIB-type zinc ribbon-containing protein [Anaerolineae bacterium]